MNSLLIQNQYLLFFLWSKEVQIPFEQVKDIISVNTQIYIFSSLVHEAVVQNNIPAVFLDGTGRCCNLFAKAIRLYNEHREKFELDDETQMK
jgi:hypothetical protein